MHRARAAIADGEGRFTIEDIAVAAPQAGEVLVEIRAAGICHTDHASLRWGRHSSWVTKAQASSARLAPA